MSAFACCSVFAASERSVSSWAVFAFPVGVSILGRAGALTAFRDSVAALRKEWEDLAVTAEPQKDQETRTELRNLGRLRRGPRTTETVYRPPIL